MCLPGNGRVEFFIRPFFEAKRGFTLAPQLLNDRRADRIAAVFRRLRDGYRSPAGNRSNTADWIR